MESRNKTTEQIEQSQSYSYKEQIGGGQRGKGWAMSEIDEED